MVKKYRTSIIFSLVLGSLLGQYGYATMAIHQGTNAFRDLDPSQDSDIFIQDYVDIPAQNLDTSTQDSEVSRNVEGYVIFLNNQPLDKKKNPNSFELSLVDQLTKMFSLGQVRPDLIRKHEDSFIQYSEYFNETVQRSVPYMHFIINEVANRKMPGEIALLPFIESRFTPSVKSSAGAKGIWQFMPATGKKYGLDLTNLYDGRDDFYAATMAALDYLEYLYSLFGDWFLAIAAYNVGENRVKKAIDVAQAQGLSPIFDNLRLPRETTNYVPRLLAVRNMIRHHKSYNLSLTNLTNKPYFKNIRIDHPISLQTVAKLANVPLFQIKELNPSYKADIYVPSYNRNLLIPRSSYRHFFDNYNQMRKGEAFDWYAFKAKNTQSVEQLAQVLNISVKELRSYNNISSDIVLAGKAIFFKVKKGSNIADIVSEQLEVVSLNEFESSISWLKPKKVYAYYNKSNKKSKSKDNGIIKVSNKKKANKNRNTSIVPQKAKKNHKTKVRKRRKSSSRR